MYLRTVRYLPVYLIVRGTYSKTDFNFNYLLIPDSTRLIKAYCLSSQIVQILGHSWAIHTWDFLSLNFVLLERLTR